jgi:hypothetical protein
MEHMRGRLPELSPSNRKELLVRLLFYEAGFEHCYIAYTADGDLAAIQWLLRPHENKQLQARFPHRFYPIGPRQVMIENAFVFPDSRSVGVLRIITMHLLATALSEGYTHAVTYIPKEKIASLNAFIALGFKIRKLTRERKLLGSTRRAL